MEIRDKKGAENFVADHLSRMEYNGLEKEDISDSFKDELICSVSSLKTETPWFADFANYLAGGLIPSHLNYQQKKKFMADVRHYIWDNPFLYKMCPDQILRRCVSKEEQEEIISSCHDGEAGGHFSANRTTSKVLQSGFFWPTLF